MKKVFLFLFLLISSVLNGHAEAITYADLTQLIGMKPGKASAFVQNKGWEYYEDEKDCIRFNYNPYYNDDADEIYASGWLGLYINDGIIDYVGLKIFDLDDYNKISIPVAKNFEELSSEDNNEFVFTNDKFLVKFRIEQNTNKLSSVNVNYFIDFYKKGGKYDPDNGLKVYELYDGSTLRYTLRNGQKEGVETKEKDDIVLFQANYKNGDYDGLMISYSNSGKLKYKLNWKDGKGVGIWNYYFYDENDNLIGKCVEDYSTNLIQFIDMTSENKGKIRFYQTWNGVNLEGQYKWYNSSQDWIIEANFIKGKLNGTANIYSKKWNEYVSHNSVTSVFEDLWYPFFDLEGHYGVYSSAHLKGFLGNKGNELLSQYSLIASYRFDNGNVVSGKFYDQVLSIGNFNNAGDKTGTWQGYYGDKVDKNNLAYEVEYLNDSKNTEKWTEYWYGNKTSGGKSILAVEYQVQNDMLNGPTKTYNCLYFKDDDGHEDRTIFPYDMDYDTTIVGDIRPTFWEGQYKNGAFDGQWIQKDETGKLIYDINYKNDQLDGAYSFFDEPGKLAANGKYEKGERIGTWKHYNDDGKVFCREIYENGQSIKMTFYDDNDNVTKEIEYSKDKPISISHYTPDLSLRIAITAKQNIEMHVFDGEYVNIYYRKLSYSDDILADMTYYEWRDMFMKNCVYEYYNAVTKQVLIQGKYYNGEKVGDWIYIVNSCGNNIQITEYTDKRSPDYFVIYENHKKKPFSGKLSTIYKGINEVITIKNDVRNGKTEIYDSKGNLISTKRYKKGIAK